MTINTIIHNTPNTKDRINTLYAIITIDKEGKEGIGAVNLSSLSGNDKMVFSVVTSDLHTANKALEIIIENAKINGINDKTFKIRKFGELGQKNN